MLASYSVGAENTCEKEYSSKVVENTDPSMSKSHARCYARACGLVCARCFFKYNFFKDVKCRKKA